MKKNKQEIIISKNWEFPIILKILNEHSKVEKIYTIVKTKNSGYMLHK